MTSVNTSTVQNQIATTIQNKPSEQAQKPVKTATAAQGKHSANFPEDIVNLSTSPSAIQTSSKDIQPSTPVSDSEKKSLLNTNRGNSFLSPHTY